MTKSAFSNKKHPEPKRQTLPEHLVAKTAGGQAWLNLIGSLKDLHRKEKRRLPK